MALEDVKLCCLQLDSDRITDRKKGSEQLRALLNNPAIVATLDNRAAGVFNWNQVFHSSRTFFLKEAKRIEDDERNKPNGSQTVLTNRANLKRAAAALPKLVLNKSSLKSPHVSGANVVDLVLTVLDRRRPYLLENFSGDFLQVANKYLLHHPTYYKEISPENWKELMKICFWLYENESASTDKLTLLKVMEGVVRCSRERENFHKPSSITKVLCSVAKFLKTTLISSSSLSSQYGLQSALLSLLLTFTKAMSSEWRYLLCSLSEETFSVVLAMWEPRPSPRQTHWLQYFNLIILIHHPQKDGKTYGESEVNEDGMQWRRCLHHLYQLLVDYLDQLATKGRLGGTGQHTVPPLLVQLSARLCHKIFQDSGGYGVLDLTQAGSTQAGGTQTNSSTNSSKRRRIEVGLSPFAALLRTEGCQLHFLPWYQVLLELLTSYAGFFDCDRCRLMLDAFTQVFAECRQSLVQDHILRCLRALAVQYKRVCNGSDFRKGPEMAIWMPVWDRTLSLVGGKQCIRWGLQLMQTLIETGLINPVPSIYKLFYQARVDMTEAALLILLTLITQLPPPKYFRNESALFSKDQMIESRVTILHLLLPVSNEGGGGVSVPPLENPSTLAHLLYCLCLHDPTCAVAEFKRILKYKEDSDTKDANDDWLKQLENLYNFSSLVCLLPHYSGNNTKRRVERRGIMVVQDQHDQVTNRLIAFLRQLDSENTFDQTNGLQLSLKVAELLVTFLLLVPDQRLEERLRDVMILVASGLEKLSMEAESVRWNSLLPHLLSLYHLFLPATASAADTQDEGPKNWSEEVREKLVPLTPPALYTVIVNLARDALTKPVADSQLATRSSFTQGSISDSMDLDFDDLSRGDPVPSRNDFQQFDDSDSNIVSEAVNEGQKLCLDDVSTWSPQNQCVWAGLTWLTAACPSPCNLDSSLPTVNPGATSLHQAINLVYDLTENTSLEMADIGMILKFVESLFVMKYNEDNVEDGLHMVSLVCSKHSADPQVAASAVRAITALLCVNNVHLSSESRNNVVALTRAFVTKLRSGIYDCNVSRAILNLSVQLCKVDSLDAWRRERSGEEGICGQISAFLSCHNHQLRISAATSVHCLLTRPYTSDAACLDQIFQELYQAVLEALTIQGSVPDDLKRDETNGRVSSFLLNLGIIALNSPYLRSRALFALCHAVPEHKVDPALVARLISRVAESTGSSMVEMMRDELPYLATQWVQHKHPIAEFPPALLACPDPTSFLSAYRNILLPSLLECDRSPAMEFLENLTEKCGREVKDLFADNFSTLMAHIFPFIAAEQADYTSVSKARIQVAKKHYKLIEKELGENFSNLMNLHIGEVIAGVVQLAHNPDLMTTGELVLTPNPPHFPPVFIHTTLAFIGRMFGENEPLFATLAKQRSELQVVLESVALGLARSRTPPAARQALTALKVTVEEVLPCLTHHSLAAAPATIRSLIHALTIHLHSLVKFAPYLADYCINLLSRVCSFTMENCPDQLIPLVSLIFARLLPLSKTGCEVQKMCIKVLGDMLRSEHQGVQIALAALPPLPCDGEYESLNELQKTHNKLLEECRGILLLREEVETFLTLRRDQIHAHCLTHLFSLLEKNQSQVNELYENVGAGQETTAHCLIHRLVTLASGNQEKVALEACRCLGKLGPVSLGSPVFYIQDPEHYLDESVDSESEATHKLLTELNRYLTDDDMEVVVAASRVLQKILATHTGYTTMCHLSHATKQQVLLLTPVSAPRAKTTSIRGLDAASYEKEIACSDMWLCGEGKYETWVSGLACALIEAGCGSDVISHLLPVCKIKPEFSALVLPLVVHAALRSDTIGRREVLSHQFSSFFHHHVEAATTSIGGVLKGKDMVTNKSALQVMLSVVDFLRTQIPQKPFCGRERITPFEKNLWLELNFLEVAQAAHYCGAHFSALLFLHLHCEGLQNAVSGDIGVERRQEPLLTQVSSHPDAPSLTTLLLQVYSSLGDRAGVEGCVSSSRFVGAEARALCCHHRGQWIQSFALKDAASDTFGMVDGLRSLGFFNTLNAFLSNSSVSNSPEVAEAQWEAAWRLAKWNDSSFEDRQVEDDISRLHNKDNENFHYSVYFALKSIHHQDIPSLHLHILTARRGIANMLRLNRVESSSFIYPFLSQLQILSEVEAVSDCIKYNSNLEQLNDCISRLTASWSKLDMRSSVAAVEHHHWEPIVAARVSMLQAVTTTCKSPHLNSLLHTTLLTKSELSREDGTRGGVGCEWAVAGAKLLDSSLPPLAAWLTRLEEAHVARKRGDVQLALRSLQPLIDQVHLQENMEPRQEQVVCRGLTLYGCLLMDSRTRNPQSIIRDYFMRAVTMLEGSKEEDSTEVLEETYYQLASYGDQLYRQLHQYLESDAIQTKRNNISRSKEEVERLEDLARNCSDLTERKELARKLTILKKNVLIDCNMLKDLEREQEDYLSLALNNYMKCLIVSEKHHLHVYRVVALWLQNLTLPNLSNMVDELGRRIKSCQFVPLLYQLVARLSCQRDQQTSFHKVLQNLLERMCVEHPHHSLPVVVALAHAHADDHIVSAKSSSRHRSKVIEEDRVQAAKALVAKLKKSAIREHVHEFEKVSLAYLSLANWCGTMDTKGSSSQQVKIDRAQPLLQLNDLRYTAALTRPLRIQPSAHYDPPLIQGWYSTCCLVGGINAPKRLTVKTSDGMKQFELLKGRDDLRQDAVMEQVFGIVNQLLAQNNETRERGLSVRTYQVVPLSQKSGLIQWCNNTQAFGEYLIGSGKSKGGGAHKLYYPKDYPSDVCRQKMMAAKEMSLEKRYEVFQDILEHFHPVFRHFFLEQYPLTHEWHRRQAAYTRSVATTSMVGYILGLGDRHVENILIDRSTAELIHIDLGIAFELGKVLPTPETVPFRMTQDMVDGLGVLGVSGGLRGDCEATLGVLRSCGEVLVTVVEVLRHDPLHTWTLSPQQVARLQATGDDDSMGLVASASMAERVVLRVRQKLAGVEDGFPRTVSEQVAALLQQATDTANLSRLFPGWRPYV